MTLINLFIIINMWITHGSDWEIYQSMSAHLDSFQYIRQ